jgi:RimJ/RimL family protein N-acetyltransferase
VNRRVEIAYFTFPGNEGQGMAISMANQLIELAMRADPTVQIFAHTLPELNASTRVLEKLGFKKTNEIAHPEDGRVWEWVLIENAQQGAGVGRANRQRAS